MKTVYLTLSPKKRWSNSSYLTAVSRPFAGKDTISIHYEGPKNHPAIFDALKTAEQLVLVMPLYVDGIPGHVLTLMEAIEQNCKEVHPSLKVYAMINCGFYEGQQCEFAMEMVECWCLRCGFSFMGGRGIGAGEMFGVLRLNFVVGVLLILVDFLINLFGAISSGTFHLSAILDGMHPLGGIITIALWVLWSLGPWFAAIKVGKSAGTGASCPVHYTTVTCCPAFLFVFFASLYWILRSLLLNRVPVWKMFRKIY